MKIQENSGNNSDTEASIKQINARVKTIESNHKNLDDKLILKLKEIDLSLLKMNEESEGRDGLILQQN